MLVDVCNSDPIGVQLSRTPYIIGDIHGCFEELLELEEAIKNDAHSSGTKPVFVCVGDLIDRGPDSKQVVDHFMKGTKKNTHFSLLGNHESEFLRIVEAFHPQFFRGKSAALWPVFLNRLSEDFIDPLKRGPITTFEGFREMVRTNWSEQGGHETIRSYDCDPDAALDWKIPAEHVHYLASLPLYWQDRDCIVTHALAPRRELSVIRMAGYGFLATGDDCRVKALVPDMSQVRDVDIRNAAQVALWNRRGPLERPDELRLHISGHTPLREVCNQRRLGYIQIDTACVYGGSLTAYDSRGKAFLSVPSNTKWEQSRDEG